MGVVLYTLLVGSEFRYMSSLTIDTPWDEPSESSPEYMAYLTGELLNFDPWTRIQGPARCEYTCHYTFADGSDTVGDVDC
jgi:serine/threonine-protein kinase Chk1